MPSVTQHQEYPLAARYGQPAELVATRPYPGRIDHIDLFFFGMKEQRTDGPLSCDKGSAVIMHADRAMSFKEVWRTAEADGLILLPRISLVMLAVADPQAEDDGQIYALGDSVRARIHDSDRPSHKQMVFALMRHDSLRCIVSHDVRHDFPPGSRFIAAPKTRS